MKRLGLAAALALAVATTPAAARIVRLEIVRTKPAFGGQAFGRARPYQHVTASAHGELDPADGIIQDLALAPRNAAGHVEYATPVELLKPADMARGNRMLLLEINRGNKLALAAFDEDVPGHAGDRNALTGAGDGGLLRQGYTLAWRGWEMDAAPGGGRLALPPVIARNADGAVTGVVRAELLTPVATRSIGLAQGSQVLGFPPGSYVNAPPASLDRDATLTVRAHEQDRRQPVANDQWSFGACHDDAAATPDPAHLCTPSGFQPGLLCELIDQARDPAVLGIGFAATRDLGEWLRNAERGDDGVANPVWRADARALLEGTSQSGRMPRSFLLLGFNRGADGRQVFDGAYPHIGGGLMPLNLRFGQPVRAWGEQTDHLHPAYGFPFSYARQHDPLTGRSQGVLDRCAATCPRLLHVATALEVWEGRQSLGLTDPLGLRDPAGMRTFIMASTQHAPAGRCPQRPRSACASSSPTPTRSSGPCAPC